MSNVDFAEIDPVDALATALVVFKPNDLATFNSGILDAVEKVAAEARARVAGADISTPAGQALIRSTAYKVAQAKVDLDELGKQLVESQKKTAAAVDASRRDMRAKLDAVKDEIRKPLTEFEEAEARRVAEHEAAIAEIEALLYSDHGHLTAAEIRERMGRLTSFPPRDWQEFKMRAQQAMTNAERQLMAGLAAAQKAERDAAELARLQREEAERAQRERDARIAHEAALAARVEAENLARLDARFLDDYHAAVLEDSEREAAARLKIVQEEAARALRERHAAEEATRLANERAEQQAAWAVENERVRVAKAQEAERVAAERREANKKHRGRVNREVVAAMVKAMGRDALASDESKAIAVAVVTAIAKGEIPHVTISY